jgi:hypothetical protein
MISNSLPARVVVLALGVALAASGSARGAQHAKASKAKAPPAAAPQAPAAPALDPKAVEILKAASARLAAAHTLSFTAVATYESPSNIGPPLAYATLSQVTMQRPDKLVVISPGDGPASEFYYDGKTMMAYAPAENLVAIADAPPTIDAMLKAAYDSAAIYFPFTDLLVTDPYADIANSLEKAFYIGQSHVLGATTTDMVGIVGNGVFAQLWVGADDKLPRMMRAVYVSDPSMLRNEVSLSDWRIDGQVPADAFTSSRAAGATRVEFARPDPKPPAAAPLLQKRKRAGTKK